jgi:hypothetical protein
MNEHGWLPKAKREELDEKLRRRLDRWYDNAYRDDTELADGLSTRS